jgi:hypothetical protein
VLVRALMVNSFSASTPTTTSNGVAVFGNEIFEFLKWGGSEPPFNVLEKTEEYVNVYTTTKKAPGPEWFHKGMVDQATVSFL